MPGLREGVLLFPPQKHFVAQCMLKKKNKTSEKVQYVITAVNNSSSSEEVNHSVSIDDIWIGHVSSQTN